MENDKLFVSLGAGPGIGLHTALRFTREGFHPVLVARSADKLARMAETIREATGREVTTVSADMADSGGIAALAERFGAATQVLHYNAAMMRAKAWDAVSPEDFAHELRVDIVAAFAAIRAFAPFMARRGSGSILLTGGGFALAPSPDFLGLSIGKAGIRCLSQALFPELAKDGVHIASLTVTKVVDAAAGDPERIADMFWDLHSQARPDWVWEMTF